MKITSPRFDYGKKIPEEYTCDGSNISPPLEISNVPQNSKSLVLIMEDPDVPKNLKPDGMWDHWIVFNIPPNTTKIEENKNPQGVLGLNTSGKSNYTGPCPPDKTHRYFFKVFALDIILNLNQGATKKQVEDSMKTHIIKEAMLMGIYEKNSF